MEFKSLFYFVFVFIDVSALVQQVGAWFLYV